MAITHLLKGDRVLCSRALFPPGFQCYGILVYTDMYMAGVLYGAGSPWTRKR